MDRAIHFEGGVQFFSGGKRAGEWIMQKKQIGGYFPYEQLSDRPNHFLEGKTPVNGELKYFMSGRCGIYYALGDIIAEDQKRTAYVPVYTCETVLAPFHKAGFRLVFYEVDENLTPVFDPAVLDGISVLSLCGYYGFSRYDRDFVAECKRRGIKIIEDTTHSVFSADGIDPNCDYIAGSFRKWLGVPCGGFAIKTNGKFRIPVKPADPEHVSLRKACIALKNDFALQPQDQKKKIMEEGNALFWKSELKLREIFDAYASDEESVRILEYYPVDTLIRKRRENYQMLLDGINPNKAFRIVFDELPEGVVPSHLTLLAENRDFLQKELLQDGISSTAYWPVGPLIPREGFEKSRYVYDHVLSLPCDQRYGREEMEYICQVLNKL